MERRRLGSSGGWKESREAEAYPLLEQQPRTTGRWSGLHRVHGSSLPQSLPLEIPHFSMAESRDPGGNCEPAIIAPSHCPLTQCAQADCTNRTFSTADRDTAPVRSLKAFRLRPFPCYPGHWLSRVYNNKGRLMRLLQIVLDGDRLELLLRISSLWDLSHSPSHLQLACVRRKDPPPRPLSLAHSSQVAAGAGVPAQVSLPDPPSGRRHNDDRWR